MKWNKILTLTLFGLFSVHCGGSEIGNPDDISLHVVGVDSSLSRLALRALPSGLTITEARMVLSEIQFKSAVDCSQELEEDTEIDFEGPYVVNLLSNQSIPDIGNASISAGNYCEVRLRLDEMEDEEVPAGISENDSIVDQSFVIRGTRGDGMPFVAFSEFDIDFRMRSAEGFLLGGASGVTDLFIAFDLNLWFQGVNLDSAEVVDGQIELSEDNNESLLAVLESNLKRSANLFEDENEDGELDDDERDDGNVLAEGDDS